MYLYRFHMEKEKNYLIVGIGSVGGSMAGFLGMLPRSSARREASSQLKALPLQKKPFPPG